MDGKENKCEKCEEGCECSGCHGKSFGGNGMCHGHWGGMCFGHHHRVGRLIIKLLVLVFIFWLGMHVGQMRSAHRAYYGYPTGGTRMMQGYGGYGGYAVPDGAVQATVVATTSPRQ